MDTAVYFSVHTKEEHSTCTVNSSSCIVRLPSSQYGTEKYAGGEGAVEGRCYALKLSKSLSCTIVSEAAKPLLRLRSTRSTEEWLPGKLP